MKTMHIVFKILTIILLTGLFQSFSGCSSTDPEPDPIVKEAITITFRNFYNKAPLEYHKLYTSPQYNSIWFTQKKYYLSNIVAIKSNGVKELIADIAILDHANGVSGLTVSGSILKESYVAIEFDLGVREDLNLKDPATYAMDHPLSVTQNMYWGWSTQYIFSKFEGFEVKDGDTTSFVIHTGTQDLYRPEVRLARSFTMQTGGNEIVINLDLYDLLNQPDYTFDLIKDGQSHTVDNLSLAVQYMDNFSKAFN